MAASSPSPYYPVICAVVVDELAQVIGLYRSSFEKEEKVQAFRVVENDSLQLMPQEADIAFRRWLTAPSDRFILRLYGAVPDRPIVISCVPLYPPSSWSGFNRLFLLEIVAEPSGKIRVVPEERWRDAKLTVAESRVAQLLLETLTSNQIADRLNITSNTVRTHIKRIYAKLHVKSRSGFVNSCLGERDLGPPPKKRSVQVSRAQS